MDARRDSPQGERVQRPTFAAHNVSLTTLDSIWLDDSNFRDLYGQNLERVRQRNFNVFFKESSNWSSSSEWGVNELRYFGYAQFSLDRMGSNFQTRGIELPPLHTNYVEAYGAVCAACAYTLGVQYPSNSALISGQEAIQQLRYLGYHVLSLDEFIETY